MRRDELDELHYITPIGNVPSICRLGILSHRRAEKVTHESVAMQEIQDRRAKVAVPGGRRLHEYVNLYVCARNPMLYKRQKQHAELCILRVSMDVLDRKDVIVADRNASSKYVRFDPVPLGLARLDRDLVFADYWTHPEDPFQEWKHKSIKCAEILVPDHVGPELLVAAYVSCDESLERFNALGVSLAAMVNRHLFFL